jgi:hypothetical protein
LFYKTFNKSRIILLKYLIFLTVFSNNRFAYSSENNYITYKVVKYDKLEDILRNHKLEPIYGKDGFLKKFLKLNPKKKKAKGNLIYPDEKIILPISKDQISLKNMPSEQINQFSTFVNINNNKGIDNSHDLKKLPENQVYITYKVKKGDMISILLKKFKAFPIYGEKGYLFKTLELNPLKKSTQGDLIYPNEYIILPILINVLIKLPDSEKSNIKILKKIPEKNIKINKEEVSFEDFQDQYEKSKKPEDQVKNKDEIKSLQKESKTHLPQAGEIKLTAILKKEFIQLEWKDGNSKIPIKYDVLRSNTSGRCPPNK